MFSRLLDRIADVFCLVFLIGFVVVLYLFAVAYGYVR